MANSLTKYQKFFLLLWTAFILLSVIGHAQEALAIDRSQWELAQAKQEASKGNFPVALKIYNHLIKAEPANLDYALGKAYVLAWSGKHQEALSLFQHILIQNPHYTDAQLGIARTHYWLGDYAAATKSLRSLEKKPSLLTDVNELKTSIQKAKDDRINFTVRAAYQLSDYSFTGTGHGFLLTGNYDEYKKWGLRGGLHFVDRFNQKDTSLSLGGTRWLTPKIYVGADAECGADTIVLPNQAYKLSFGYAGFKNLILEGSYRFADFDEADSHAAQFNLTWTFLPNWDIDARYGLSFVDTALGQKDTNHSGLARLIRALGNKGNIFAGYAFGQESFDSGNVAAPLGAFTSQHLLLGGRYNLSKSIGADMLFDFERRSNGQQISTFEFGLSHTW